MNPIQYEYTVYCAKYGDELFQGGLQETANFLNTNIQNVSRAARQGSLMSSKYHVVSSKHPDVELKIPREYALYDTLEDDLLVFIGYMDEAIKFLDTNKNTFLSAMSKKSKVNRRYVIYGL